MPAPTSNSLAHKVRFFWPAGIWAAIIFGLSVMPGSSLPKFTLMDFLQPDKVGHLVVYAVLVALLLWGYRKRDGQWPVKKQRLQIWGYSILYGIAIECIQQFLTDRHFDVLDIIANIIGCSLGLTIVYFINRKI
ncbi:MAG: VanZ family protein [Bacteroidota bacterium]